MPKYLCADSGFKFSVWIQWFSMLGNSLRVYLLVNNLPMRRLPLEGIATDSRVLDTIITILFTFSLSFPAFFVLNGSE